MDAEMTMTMQQPNMNPVKYSKSLWLKVLNHGLVYDEAMLKGTSIEGLDELTHQSMRAYLGSQKPVTFQELVRQATWPRSRQFGSGSPVTIPSPAQAQGRLGHRRDCSNRNVMVKDYFGHKHHEFIRRRIPIGSW